MPDVHAVLRRRGEHFDGGIPELDPVLLREFSSKLKDSAPFSTGVFLSGVVGDTVGGVISDRILKRTGNVRAARCRLIAAGLFGGFVFMIPVVLVHDFTVVALCLSLAFFFVELAVAPIWSVPMDIAPRCAGSASGIMNFGFGMAGIDRAIVDWRRIGTAVETRPAVFGSAGREFRCTRPMMA